MLGICKWASQLPLASGVHGLAAQTDAPRMQDALEENNNLLGPGMTTQDVNICVTFWKISSNW